MMKKIVAALACAMASEMAFSAGFALYEGSARGNALGGAVMGKARDASANFYNPATLSDMTGTVVTVGMTTEHPTAGTTVNGVSSGKMNPGCFVLPHAYLSQSLPYGFTFGFGFAPEYGLGTHYRKDWRMAWNTRDTTIEGVVLNPNLTYKVTDKWSVSAGIRLLNLTFDQHSDQMAVSDGYSYGTIRDHLKGDNGMIDWGWQISSKYDITEKLSVGVMYKSYIDSKVKGFNHTRVEGYNDVVVQKGVQAATAQYFGTPQYAAIYSKAYQEALMKAHQTVAMGAGALDGDASAKIRLPQSLTVGLNYDATEKLHLGTAATWTEWSSIQGLHFNLPHNLDKDLDLKWNDSWRIGFGGAYDLTDEWTLMMSYVFDMDPCRKYYGTTMLPPGDRHIATIGLGYTWGSIDIVASYGLVFMSGDTLHTTDPMGNACRFSTHDGLSHAASVSLSYHF